MRPLRRAGLALVVITAACVTDLSVGPRVPVSLSIIPSSASVIVGQARQLLAVARDSNGVPFVGLPTTWTSDNPAVATIASTGVALGVTVGSATIVATAGGQTASAVVTVTPAPLIGLSRTTVPVAGTPGAPDPAPETVTITNTGGGSLDDLQLGTTVYSAGATGWLAATLNQANAPASLTLTAATGSVTIGSYSATVPVTSATASNSPQNVTVTLVVAAGGAATIELQAGDGQSASVSTAVAVPPAVIVRDAFSNPVAGVAVTFAVTGGGGSLTGPNPATTNALGIAQIGWTLGTTLGANSLTASATGLAGSPVTFTATATAGPAATIAASAGDAQTTTVGTAVAVPPAVLVTDAQGNPVAGVTVTFAVTAGGGNISDATPATNASGIAPVGGWVLGTTAGTNTLTATVSGLSGSPVTFNATGTAGAPNQLTKSAGDNQSATVGTAVATGPTVLLRDAFNNPIAGVTVTFALTGGGGSLTGPNPATTDATGTAQVGWVLGTTAGANTLSADAAGLSTVSFAATGTPGSATAIAKTAGDAQTAQVGTAVAIPPQVQARDQYGNGVAGVSVSFAVTGGGGGLTGPNPATTNASGFAQIGWTLGNLIGANTLTATAAGLNGSPLTFTATGVTVGATQIAADAGQGQSATVNSAVAVPPRVLVTDPLGNPVAGVAVTFAVTSGGGNISGANQVTNASGLAQVGGWVLGQAAGANSLAATAPGLTGSPVVFTATGTAGAATQLTVSAGDGQSATVNTAVGTPPRVVARDAFSNPVAGVSVTFAVTGGGGSLTGTNPATTDASGFAQIGWVLGQTAGANSLTASATGLSGSPVGFTATGTPGAATQLVTAAGNGQTATVGTLLPVAPRVQARDQFGNGAPGVSVTFAVTAGGGNLSGTSPVTTDANGFAQIGWTLGTVAGANALAATAAGLAGSPATFTATGTPGAATALVKTAGDNQTTGAGGQVAILPQVQARDQFGNGVPGVLVTFAVTAGGGSLTGVNPATTDAGGFAQIDWTLGAVAGVNTLTATAAGLSVATFTATGTAGGATQIAASAGNGQTAAVNTAVGTAPAVIVRDALNNPVAGVNVTFSVAVGGGTIDPTSPAIVATNASGIAALTSWTLGTVAGTNTLTATAAGLTGSPVTFTATGTPGAATQLTKNGGDAQSATVNTAVGIAPQVLVRDAFNNPVPGVSVTFAVASGGGSVTGTNPATTNAAGLAQIDWTLGTIAGANSLTADVAGLTGVTFTATGTAGAATQLTKNAGDAQSATVNAAVAVAPQVLVRDAFNNPVPGAVVTFAVASGGGSLTDPNPASTNAAGLAQIGWTLGTVAGANSLTADVAGLTGVTFTATGTADVAAQVVKTAGDAQSAQVNTAVPAAPQVQAQDQFGNGVAGVDITFSEADGATIMPASPATIATNAGGFATLTFWTLGPTVTTYTVTATATGLSGSPLTFTATSFAGGATTMALSAGDNQTATVGTALPVSYAVLVTDGVNPVPGIPVTWTVTGGGGSISPPSSVTDASGIATATRTLSTTAGVHTATASVGGLTGSPVTFTATATADAAANIAIQAGNGQSATVGTTVATAPAALVRDQFTNPVPGVNVTFTLTGGDGTISPASPATIATNASGIAALTSWTLGVTAGANTLSAAATGLTGSPLTFTATGTAGAATQIALSQGDGQTATVNTAVATAPRVLVRDASNNPVAGVAVTFAVTAGGGSLTGPNPAITDPSGFASIGWTLGTAAGASNNTLTATATGLTGSPVTFTASATAGAATQIAVSQGSGQTATVNTAVATPPRVVVRDAFSNPVAGVSVTFAVTAGGGSLTGINPATTDAAGFASIAWTLGTAAGASNNTLSAAATDLAGSPVTFTASATAGAPSAAQSSVAATSPITASSGGSQSVITVTVRDQFNNPVAGANVTWAVTGTGHTTVSASGTTNASGVFNAGRLSSTVAESKTVSAIVNPGPGQVAITQTAAVVVNPTAASGATSTVSAGTASITACAAACVAGSTASVITVTARDTFSNVLPGAAVVLAASGASNAFAPAASGTAGGSGVFTATFSSTTAQAKTISATVNGVSIAPSAAVTVTADAAATIALNAGDGQSAVVNTAVGVQPSVIVRDQFSNPVAGTSVTFAVTGGGGTVNPVTAIATNESGIAQVTSWTVGTAVGTGNNTLSATSAGLAGSPVTFTASATVGAPSAGQSSVAATSPITASGGASQSVITVTVRDAFSNPIPGANVTWSASGTGNTLVSSSGTTDAAGVFSAGRLSSTVAASKTVSAIVNPGPGQVAITQTATVVVNPDAISAAQSLVSAAPGTIAASAGGTTSTITVTVRDQFLNPIAGATVVLAASGSSNTLTQPVATTNASGVTTGTLASTLAQAKTVSATANGIGLTATANVTVTAAAAQTIALNAGSGQTATVNTAVATPPSVIVRDQFANPVQGTSVTFAVTGGGGSLTGTNPAATNSAGIAQIGSWILGTTAGLNNNTLTATAAGLTGSPVAFTASAGAGAPSGAVSTIAATSPITASSGANQSVITITVRDQFSNPISGASVTWAASGTGNTTSNTSGTTDGSGVFNTGRLSSTVAQSKTISATINGAIAITPTATVVVNAAGVNAGTSTVAAATATITACNTGCSAGSTASTITVTARDAFSNLVASAAVTISSNGSNNVFTPASGSTNASGIFTTTFNSQTAQAKTITAVAGGVTITQTAAVTVNAAQAALIQITAGNNQTARVTANVATAPSVTVRDAFNNVASGRTVTFASVTGGGSVSPGSAVTNASGVASLTTWTLGGTSTDAANGTMANGFTASVSPCSGTCSVVFSASAIYFWSLDVVSLFNGSSPYACNTCHEAQFTRSPTNTIVGVAATTGTACDGQVRVSAGNAAGSVLYLKVDSSTVNQCGSKMPLTASFFSAAELKRLRAWINNGALNN